MNMLQVARICLLLRTMPALPQRPIYTQGDIASEMYIVLSGHLQVTFCSTRSTDSERCSLAETSCFSYQHPFNVLSDCLCLWVRILDLCLRLLAADEL